MKKFSALLGFCAGNSSVTDEFPKQRPAFPITLQWRHNARDCVSNHQIPRTNGPVTRKMFPFDDVILKYPHGVSVIWLLWWYYEAGVNFGGSFIHEVLGCLTNAEAIVAALNIVWEHTTTTDRRGHNDHGCMMTSSNGNIFRVTGPLCGEFTGHRWIPLTKASVAELWCFLWSAPL